MTAATGPDRITAVTVAQPMAGRRTPSHTEIGGVQFVTVDVDGDSSR